MKNFLVPISVRPNSMTDDHVTVGMLAFNETDSYYDYSYDKLKLVGPFLDENSRKYLEKSLETFRTSLIPDFTPDKLELDRPILNENYLDYLTKYSKGLIRFESPKGFAIELNEETFNKAFKHFVGAEPGRSTKPVTSFRKEINGLLKNEAFKAVDVNYTIHPDIAPEIYAPHKVDFIGVNGSPFAGVGIDFTKSPEEVDKSILTFRIMVRGIESLAAKFNKGLGVYEAYFNDPETTKNKELLDKIRKDKSKGFELVEIERFDKTISRIKNGNYKKFSKSELISIPQV
ncbi:hypothetical protein [Litoribacter populi]|uniref:hypothetical protein n=1 Tax=Litoribacter populi TaxID=2598460 RepID=UPI00117DBBD9|nr:hypothetical protein [Litoribacter populi]